jgi:hypothetical protein
VIQLKSYALYLALRVGVGGLLKAAQEASLASPSGHWLLHHINSCKTSEETDTGAQYVVYKRYICRSPPHVCQYRGFPLPSAESRGEA